jgi:hypothetical protein
MKSENKANQALLEKIAEMRSGIAWERGVRQYAIELVQGAEIPLTMGNLRRALLGGADDWKQYSYGGCALIYDCDIAQRLCSPSYLKRKRGGALPPSRKENWLDVQARALWQAEAMISRALHRMETVAA